MWLRAFPVSLLILASVGGGSLHALPLPLVASFSTSQTRLEATTHAAPRYPWKTDIVATVFWVGEQPTKNNPVPNTRSSWDARWVQSFGGYYDPDPGNRSAGFHPTSFLPRQNPFYVALPYNDVTSKSTKKEASSVIPWFKEAFTRDGKSVCHNRWLAIHHRGRVCFAQWSDCGPFTTSDAPYVFGSARPSNTKNAGAGIDVSPAVRDYLGIDSGEKCDWRFVDAHEVGEGPWKYFGTNNPFSLAHAAERASVFTAEYQVSTFRPTGRSAKTEKTAKSEPRSTKEKPVSKGRLEELRAARERWFDTK